MRICTIKATGKLIEMQSAATEGTLIKNAIAAGYSEADIEEREITDEEWTDPAAPWNQPTDEQLEAAAESKRQAEFDRYDKVVGVLRNSLERGDITQEEYAVRVAPWHAFAEALRAINDTDGWYLNPQWPARPEA